jgi:predicted nucleotidyltransferase
MAAFSDILNRREDILRIAVEHGARDVRIFGSVVRGEADGASDLDVLVKLDDDRYLLGHVALKQDLEDLLACKGDVVTECALHALLRDRIPAEAMPL